MTELSAENTNELVGLLRQVGAAKTIEDMMEIFRAQMEEMRAVYRLDMEGLSAERRQAAEARMEEVISEIERGYEENLRERWKDR